MRYLIEEKDMGKSIKAFLKENNVSYGLVKKLKKIENGITVNGKHQNVVYLLEKGDVLNLLDRDTADDMNEYLKPVDLPIDIIYEDENITVVNKPANMPTHQSINNHDNTLANALKYRYRDKPYVFRAANRLDKDTSGIVITSNNRYYASLISNKIKKGEIVKEYIAVVDGLLEGDGVINAPIGRVGKSIIKREVRDDGEEAITEYSVIASTKEVSVVLVKPKTGRTHQIRVHMSYIGHPIIGDAMYFEKSAYIDRQALHCTKMDLGEIGAFYAKLPKDIKDLIRRYFKDEEISY